ncbi:glycosyltransferase family 4 protein [Crocosphaera sp. XPORK-15E]|uniref:glycosyltransferase family 4 protein n=1 Tax=Crocosphaera sp. XPORK-15E TaxID=3110247 RepID=UPI003A4DA929
MVKILFAATSVGFLGSGFGGGAELTLYNIATALQRRGYEVEVMAAAGSKLPDIPVIEIEGNVQISAQTQDRNTPIILPPNSLLANMWEYARSQQNRYDLIFNLAYDWLPIYLTPFFQCPVAHIIVMSSISQFMDEAVIKLAHEYPLQVAFYTHAQIETFGLKNVRLLSNAIDVEAYSFSPTAKNQLAWVSRISPEKGLEDAIAAAQQVKMPLKVMGMMQDPDYWQAICNKYPDVDVEYLGFLSQPALQEALGSCKGMLMTQKWVEAFGKVVIEALACGVPVIAYRRGGPAEIIQDGKTGFLIEPDSIPDLVAKIPRLDEINRQTCRLQAEDEFSLTAMGDRVERWIQDILSVRGKNQSKFN